MDVQAYLDRIQYQGELNVSLSALKSLHRQHLLCVPFENLDIHYGKEIILEPKMLYEKIVLRKRGGFCYELNIMFSELLKVVGFETRIISARVHVKDEEYSPEFDHMALLVSLKGKTYLADVGFGRFVLEPLELRLNRSLKDPNGQFMIYKYNRTYLGVHQIEDGAKIPQYIFTKRKRKIEEFKAMCRFHQTDERSHFKKKKVVSISTKTGRITLNNTSLKITEGKKKQEVNFKEDEFETYLERFFNVQLNY